MNLADSLNKLADLDYDIIRLEGERALAQHAADTAQVARLDEEMARIYKAIEELRAGFRSRHAGRSSRPKTPIWQSGVGCSAQPGKTSHQTAEDGRPE
jgi:hypothetical protein